MDIIDIINLIVGFFKSEEEEDDDMEIKGVSDRDLFVKLAWKYVGKPYTWGGDDPVAGFDCSGLVCSCAKAVGALPRGKRLTADGLMRYFEEHKAVKLKKPVYGAVVFWGGKGGDLKKAIHVEICINDHISIGASGGGSKVRNMVDAVKYNAFVKPRPIIDSKKRPVIAIFDLFDRDGKCIVK